MESMLLDLRKQRCPLALLLAKRHTAQLFEGENQQYQKLVMQIMDKSSKTDIVNYLTAQGYVVDCQSNPNHYTLTVFKKESA